MREDFFSFSGSGPSGRNFVEIEKAESTREFISGIVRELNDPLSAILGFSEVLQSVDIAPEIKRYVDNIHIAALRSARIVEGLLTFMRKKDVEFAVINVNDVIRQTVSLFEYQMRTKNVSLSLNLSQNMPDINGDFYKLQQVFFNILMNALQALETWHKEKSISLSSELAGNIIRITVSDSGPGVCLENIGKIFTPFFSTKPRGTGLGLSIAYGIIKEHGGKISMASGHGGCSFAIDLIPVSFPDNRRNIEVRNSTGA